MGLGDLGCASIVSFSALTVGSALSFVVRAMLSMSRLKILS